MAKRTASKEAAEPRRPGTFIATVSFLAGIVLYYVFLQGRVPQQLEIVVMVCLGSVTYVIGLFASEYMAQKKDPAKRKIWLNRDLRAAVWFLAGMCLLLVVNFAALLANIEISSLVNLVLVLVLLVVAWVLSRPKR